MENHGKPTAEQTKGDARSLQQGSAPSPTPSLFLDAKAAGQVKISIKAKPQGLKATRTMEAMQSDQSVCQVKTQNSTPAGDPYPMQQFKPALTTPTLQPPGKSEALRVDTCTRTSSQLRTSAHVDSLIVIQLQNHLQQLYLQATRLKSKPYHQNISKHIYRNVACFNMGD